MKKSVAKKWTLKKWLSNLDLIYTLSPRDIAIVRESFWAGQSAGQAQERRRLRRRAIQQVPVMGGARTDVVRWIFGDRK